MNLAQPSSGRGQRSIPVLSAVWRQVKDFSGLSGDATYLWPRWLVLRGVGLVFIVIFSGIIAESEALIGPRGLAPLSGLIAQLKAANPSAVEGFLHAPSLFWFNSSPGAAVALEWCGLLAAVALVLNLWPRMSLFVCWLGLLSFANAWLVFSDPLVDWLMLETALICIPFAPAGFRPGLGAKSPPRPIAVFMVRWLLFRVMFESGVSKLISADPRWINLTAMDDLYETAPAPTILGYLVHQLPHAWHVGEIWLTFAAEVAAPLLAVFAGRRGRWFAFWSWTVFQLGIQLTCNFGWLNTSSITLGFLLFDDQMLADAAGILRLRKLAQIFAAPSAKQTVSVIAPWRLYGLRAALWTHFYLTVVHFGTACKVPENVVLDSISEPLKYLFQGFGSVNSYTLYAWLDQAHRAVEFTGSNDGGRTWRTFDLRYYPQRADRICPFIAPWLPRFEAAMQIELATRDNPTSLFGITAIRLLERNPEVMSLFERDPFPDRPPQMIRLPVYGLTFTDLATHRSSRMYWNRRYLGEYMPMKYVDATGQIKEAATAFEQAYVKAAYGNPQAQNYLGYLYVSGEEDVTKDGAEAAKWYRRAAEQGVAGAQFNLALIYSNGDGVPKDAAEAMHWCRMAAEQGLPDAQDRLGIMYYQGEGLPKDDTEALVWLNVAVLSGFADAAKHRDIVEFHASQAVAQAAAQRAKVLFAEIEARKKSAGN